MSQAQRYLGTWDFGERGHSALGHLCHLRQVSRASTEAGVVLGCDLATFGISTKQSGEGIRFVAMQSGLDTSSVRGDVGFIHVHASSSCFSVAQWLNITLFC